MPVKMRSVNRTRKERVAASKIDQGAPKSFRQLRYCMELNTNRRVRATKCEGNRISARQLMVDPRLTPGTTAFGWLRLPQVSSINLLLTITPENKAGIIIINTDKRMNQLRQEMCRQMEQNILAQEPFFERKGNKLRFSANSAPMLRSSLSKLIGRPVQFSERSLRRAINSHNGEDHQRLEMQLQNVKSKLKTTESRLAVTERQLITFNEQMQAVEVRAKNTAYAALLIKDAILSGFFQPAQPIIES
jgi:hypothetical protein